MTNLRGSREEDKKEKRPRDAPETKSNMQHGDFSRLAGLAWIKVSLGLLVVDVNYNSAIILNPKF